jgi:hypothetical protein
MARAQIVSSTAFLITVFTAAAQTPAPDAQTPAPAPASSPWSAGPIDFSGLVDGYYSFNFQHPASGTNVWRNFDIRANQFHLNMAKLEMQHAPDPVGFRLDLGFGRAFDIFHATEPLDQGRGIMRQIPQAFVSIKPPKAGGFQFDFGKFYTQAGAELTETHLNWNYSRALLYANGPYYHFGARMTKPIAGPWTMGFQILNGWNNVEDNNSGKTYGITSAVAGKKAALYNNYYVGPEKAGTNKGYRHFFDTVLTLTPTDKFSAYINYDVAVDKAAVPGGEDNNFWGIAFAARQQVSPSWAMAARYEYYRDEDGFITGAARNLQEFTATLEYKLAKGFLSRLEYRRDWSNVPFFDRGNEPGSSKNMDTLLLGYIVYFGPK